MPTEVDAPDLIPLDRAKQALNQGTWTAAEEALLAQAIRVASDCARRWCRSPLALGTFEEVHGKAGLEGGIRVSILPARRLLRVATDPGAGLLVSSPSGGWVRVTTTTLEVVVGADPVVTLGLGDHATLAALAAALAVAVPTLTVSVAASEVSPADLVCTGARLELGAGPLELKVFRTPLGGWKFRSREGVAWCGGASGMRGGVRLVVVAGYLPLPAAVEEATAQWAAVIYRRMLGQSSGLPGDTSHPTESIRLLLAPYRCYPLGEPAGAARNYPT